MCLQSSNRKLEFWPWSSFLTLALTERELRDWVHPFYWVLETRQFDKDQTIIWRSAIRSISHDEFECCLFLFHLKYSTGIKLKNSCYQYRPKHIFLINVLALFVCPRVGKTLMACLSINVSLVIAVCHSVSSSVTDYKSFSWKKKYMIAQKPFKGSSGMTRQMVEYIVART